MQIHLLETLRALAGIGAGVAIGVCFGMIQDAAWRRYQRRQEAGQFNTGWAAMPGSFRRVASLLIALVLVQFLCPMLFTDGFQWWVSGGVVAGYGIMLGRNLRQRLTQTKLLL